MARGFMHLRAREIYEALRPIGAHESHIEKIKVLSKGLRDVFDRDVKGDVFEFGVWKGFTSVPLACTIIREPSSAVLHLFDTFEGLPASDPEKDIKIKAKTQWPLPPGTLAYSLEDFQSTFTKTLLELCGETGLYKLHKGDVRNLVTKDNLGSVAFAVFDVDYYDSTRHLFETVAPQVTLDGVIYVDDYYTWQGAKQATEEFLEDNKEWKPFIVRSRKPYYFLRRV